MKKLFLITLVFSSCSNLKAQDSVKYMVKIVSAESGLTDSCTFKEIIDQLKPSKYTMVSGAYGWSFYDVDKNCLTYYPSTNTLYVKDSLCAIQQLIKSHEKDQKRILELYEEINERQNLLNRAIKQIDIANGVILELIISLKKNKK